MSRPVKNMIVEEYNERFGDTEAALVIDIRGITANQNNSLRLDLAKQNVRITVVKNSLAKKAFSGTKLEKLGEVLDGPSALAYGGESVVNVARTLVDWAKKIEKLDLKGAILDGELFEGAEGVKRLSTFPTREEAQAKVVTLILSPARNVMGAVKGPGSKVLAVVKSIEEKLEKGETISKN